MVIKHFLTVVWNFASFSTVDAATYTNENPPKTQGPMLGNFLAIINSKDGWLQCPSFILGYNTTTMKCGV